MEHQLPRSNKDEQPPASAGNSVDRPELLPGLEYTAAEAEQAPRHPRIYIVDLASAECGISHGLWIDANQSAQDLDADIAAMLDSSPTIGATSWAVAASRDFAGLDLTAVTETALISRLAGGVAEHGAAFVAWLQIVGHQSDRLDRFNEFYIGSFETAEAWARSLAESLDWHRQLDRGITDPLLRPYVGIDYQAMLHDARGSWDIVDGADGMTHVFSR